MKQITDFLLKIFFFIVFVLIVTPAGFLLRLAGVDYLKRGIEKNKKSYWINKP